MDEPETEQERAEAEALARRIDGDHVDAPRDATEAAGLLAVRTEPRFADVRARVLVDAKRTTRRRRVRLGLVVGGSLLAAAAAALLLVRPAPGVRPYPEPPIALLEAQLRAASGTRDEALEATMAGYRAELHAALVDRYGR